MKLRLSVMMFLEFFIWGGWFVTMGSYLGASLSASGAQIGLAYATQSWGAIIAPFIFGLIADRYFNAERVLAATHLVGGVLLLAVARSATFPAFYPLLLVYMILYMPTLALVNAIAFRQLRDPSREFSNIRVWGTIGWIVAGLVHQLRVRLGLLRIDRTGRVAQHVRDVRHCLAGVGCLQPDSAEDAAGPGIQPATA